MKKTAIIGLIIIILFNLITVKSFAEESKSVTAVFDELGDSTGVSSKDNLLNDLKKGEVTLKNDNDEDISTSTKGTTYFGPTVFKVLVEGITIIPQIINQIMETTIQTFGNKDISTFTIYDTVMGNYELFNIDYHKIPEEPTQESPPYKVIKYNAIMFYSYLRNFAIALSLFVLLYIGIRMVTSTLSTDKAKYNKMLLNWVASLILLFMMHYIIIIISSVLETALQIVQKVSVSGGVSNIEEDLYKGIVQDLSGATGWNMFTAVVMIFLFTYYQVKFFIYYLHRLLEIGFLIVVSPLIMITYPIDKIGDNKAQAFQALVSELMLKASIQLMHAIIYCVFIASAGVIAEAHPIIAILFFSTLTRAEKIVKKIFGLKDDGFEKTKVPLVG